jgi:hypothetical protein
MTDAVPTPPLSAAEAAKKPAALDTGLWEQATPAQQQVLKRIAKQRARLHARAAARAQSRTLRETPGAQRVSADAPLAERATAFVRLHPVATAVAGAALMAIGPRKLLRWAGIAWPWIVKLQQRRAR